VTQFDLIWLNLTQFDSIWLNLTQFDSIWLNLTQFDLIWLKSLTLLWSNANFKKFQRSHWHRCDMHSAVNDSTVITKSIFSANTIPWTAESLTPLWCAQRSHWLRCRVSSKQTNKKFRFEPKQTETQSVSVDFWFVSRNQKFIFRFASVFRIRFKTTETNRSVSKQTEINKKKWKICWKEENLIMYF
jgi:hypothetical protein